MSTYRKIKTVKKAFRDYLSLLNFPPIRLIVKETDMAATKEYAGSFGIFSVDKSGKPYIVLWRLGWRDDIIKHELIHYMQYLVDGDKVLKTGNLEEPQEDLFEKEAYSLMDLPDLDLAMYIQFRMEYKNFS
jgi:hypothetical protein